MKIKLTRDDAQEVLHKLTVMVETPDLYYSYSLCEEQAVALANSVPQDGGEWTVPEWAVEAVKGEMQNHAEILKACADAARAGGDVGQSLRIYKQAKKFETIFN